MKALMISVALLLLTLGCAETQAGTYAQLSSGVNQVDGVIAVEQVDGIQGMSVDDQGGIVVDRAGDYVVILAPQVEKGGSGQYGDFWIRVNGVDVPNSNVRIYAGGDVIVSQGVLSLKRGDVIQFVQSGTLGIEAIAEGTEPLIPSVIVSVFRI